MSGQSELVSHLQRCCCTWVLSVRKRDGWPMRPSEPKSVVRGDRLGDEMASRGIVAVQGRYMM